LNLRCQIINGISFVNGISLKIFPSQNPKRVRANYLRVFLRLCGWLAAVSPVPGQQTQIQYLSGPDKRAITSEEHHLIIEREKNPERRSFYELCWHLGGSQTDIANLKAEDIDWPNQTIAFARRKTGSLAMIHFGPDIEAILRRQNAVGPLFPYLQSVRSGDRATEFKERCEGLGIKGVTLHSYRYARAERAKTCG
jgi:integrase